MPLSWSRGGRHAERRAALIAGELVSAIHRQGRTHKPSSPDELIYSVEVMGQRLPSMYRYVRHAKDAANAAYEALIAR